MMNEGKGKDKGGFNPGKGQWPSQPTGKGGKAHNMANLLSNMLRAVKGQQGEKGWKGGQWSQPLGKGWNNQGKGGPAGQSLG